jgi:thiol-disulfide isomerase/thioredoxin
VVQKYINWRRALTGAFVLALILAPLYVLVLRPERDHAVLPARLLDTPTIDGAGSAAAREGRPAPDFEISTPNGQRLRLSDLRGRPVLINFWATWCGSCLSEMPAIKGLQEDRGPEAFTVLAINAGEPPAAAQEFIDFLDAPFLYGLDVDLRVTDAYGVYGLPLSAFVDSTGVIRAVYRGHADAALLARFVDAAIAARPPGEVAPILRIVSTIPRERVLSVRDEGGRIVSHSRALRCDSLYCAEVVVAAMRDVRGVTRAELSDSGGTVTMSIEFDVKLVDARSIVDELARRLGLHPDPLYDGPMRVRYEGS